jgi:hypothetical protein
MNQKKRRKLKLGDVYAIPLPDGNYAFGRTFWDGAIAIYEYISTNIEELPPTENYQFIVGVYEHVLKSGEWPVVDNRPFNNDEEIWPPPTCVIDSISGEYSIYYKGEFREAKKSDCEGLEVATVWGAEHIIDRIMGDDKWHKDSLK